METNNKPLEVTQQQLNLMAAGVLMIAFFSFLAGYLSMPDRAPALHSIEQLSSATESPQIALNRGYVYETAIGNLRNESINQTQLSVAEESSTESASIGAYFPLKRNHQSSAEIPNPSIELTSNHEKYDKSDKEYYASVAGFGTVEAARMCKERLQTLGIATEIITRSSATVSGVSRTWYQLITLAGSQKEIEQRARRIQRIIPTVSIVRIQH